MPQSIPWEIPDEGAADVLRYALDDEDEEVRARAAAALRKRQVIDVWRRTLGSQVEEEEHTPKKTRKPSGWRIRRRSSSRAGRMSIR